MGSLSVKQQFLEPDDSFSPVPFWFWNGDLQEQELTRQIEDFHDKGVNAFVIHPRMGIPEDLEYMSDRFLSLVKFAVEEAARLNMKVVLYDEAMYPSGSAHGMVAAYNPAFKSHGLRCVQSNEKFSDTDTLLLEQDGVSYVLGFTNGTIRGVHFGEDDREALAPKSTDLLNKDAVQYFISITHEKYYKVLSKYFGNTIIGMFTDEPCIMGRNVSMNILPWSPDFLDFYLGHGGNLSDIPKLWENGEERALYNKLLTLRLEETYYLPISRWCEDHGIALMGHPEKSDDIGLLKHFHIPGQDLVLRFVAPEKWKSLEGVHSTQAKCSSDSARHAGLW